MAIPRLTLARTIWSKLNTQLAKKDHAQTLAEIKRVRRTQTPTQAQVLWEPPPALVTKIRDILIREETYTRDRQKGSTGHQLMLTTIANLQSYLDRAASSTGSSSEPADSTTGTSDPASAGSSS
jgi:hypothetical protein